MNDVQEFGLRHHFPARKYKKNENGCGCAGHASLQSAVLVPGNSVSEMIFIYISVRYFFSYVLRDVLVVLEMSN